MSRVQVTTETTTYPDGAVSRTQTIVTQSTVRALVVYRMLAEVDALNLGEALERIAGE